VTATATGQRGTTAGVRHPHLAALLLLVALLFRQSLPDVMGVNAFLVALLGVVVVTGWHLARQGGRIPPIGLLEVLIVVYLGWNLFSLAWPQVADSWAPGPQAPLPTWRFVLTGVAIPLLMYLVGRICFRSDAAARHLLWAIMAFGAYSAFVSIGQFHLPGLVWPRYIVEAPNWEGRANGVPNQPVVNGLILILGYLASMAIVTRRDVSRVLRWAALLVAAATAYGVFLTHTRAAWGAFFIVTVCGAVWMTGARRQFVAVLTVMVLAVGIGWSTFTSSDREAGGVASVSEIDDRLNLIATQVWAFQQEPLLGWGVGTFATLNVRHHQQFSPDQPWVRGYGVASHQNELGILVELGLVGLMLWLGLLVLLWARAVRAVRAADDDRLEGRTFAVLAVLAFVALLATGLTVDLRYFDFINALVFLLLGSATGVTEAARSRSVAGGRARRDHLVLAR
jgi:O-antigen ligase